MRSGANTTSSRLMLRLLSLSPLHVPTCAPHAPAENLMSAAAPGDAAGAPLGAAPADASLDAAYSYENVVDLFGGEGSTARRAALDMVRNGDYAEDLADFLVARFLDVVVVEGERAATEYLDNGRLWQEALCAGLSPEERLVVDEYALAYAMDEMCTRAQGAVVPDSSIAAAAPQTATSADTGSSGVAAINAAAASSAAEAAEKVQKTAAREVRALATVRRRDDALDRVSEGSVSVAASVLDLVAQKAPCLSFQCTREVVVVRAGSGGAPQCFCSQCDWARVSFAPCFSRYTVVDGIVRRLWPNEVHGANGELLVVPLSPPIRDEGVPRGSCKCSGSGRYVTSECAQPTFPVHADGFSFFVERPTEVTCRLCGAVSDVSKVPVKDVVALTTVADRLATHFVTPSLLERLFYMHATMTAGVAAEAAQRLIALTLPPFVPPPPVTGFGSLLRASFSLAADKRSLGNECPHCAGAETLVWSGDGNLKFFCGQSFKGGDPAAVEAAALLPGNLGVPLSVVHALRSVYKNDMRLSKLPTDCGGVEYVAATDETSGTGGGSRRAAGRVLDVRGFYALICEHKTVMKWFPVCVCAAVARDVVS